MIPNNIQKTKTGRLVLTGGQHGVKAMFKGERPPAPQTVNRFHQNIRKRSQICQEKGIGYCHYVFPDPLNFAADEMPNPNGWISYYLTYFTQKTTQNVRYPLRKLTAPELQLQTDTHYSPEGYARLASDIAEDLLGLQTQDILSAALATSKDTEYVGDLGVQCDPQHSERIQRQAPPKALRLETNGLESGNQGILDLLENPDAATDKSLLIFGDSFFRGMLTELSRYWRHIVFLRTPFMHVRMIDAVAPDHILTGMAERYLSSVPSDTDATEFLAMPLASSRSTKPSQGFGDLFNKLVDQQVLEQGTPSGAPVTSDASPSHARHLEEQMAFASWMVRQGRDSGLTGSELSDAWASARAKTLEETRKTLAFLQARGIDLKQD